MKSSKTVLFGALALAALASAAHQGGLLRRELKVDAKDVYKIDSSLKQAMAMAQGDQDLDVKSTMTYTLSTKTVDAAKGQADVEAETKFDTLAVTGSVAEMLGGGSDKPAPFKVKGTLDSRNRFVPKQLPKMNPLAAMMGSSTQVALSAMFVELPEKEVKVGDTWTVVVPKSPFTGDVNNTLTATLKGEKVVDGQKVLIVAVSGQIKVDTDSTKLKTVFDDTTGFPDIDATIKGTIDFDGEGLVDQASGKTVSMTSTMKNKSTVVAAGMEIQVTGSGTLKLNLVKPGA